MNFLVIRAENVVAIDNAVAEIDCAALPANVAKVVWNGSAGALEYNDRPKIWEAFTDPSPYLALLNAWLTAAAAAAPALPMAQSKAVKTALIDTLYRIKRQLPYTSIGHDWDAGDEGVAALTQGLWSVLQPQPMVDSANALVAAVNADMAKLKQDLTIGGAIDSGGAFITNGSGGLLATNAIAVGDTFGGAIGGGHPLIPAGAYAGFANAFAGTLAVIPFAELTPVTLTGAQVQAIIAGIVARRNTLQATRLTKTSAVAALGSIAAVVAYDIAAGW